MSDSDIKFVPPHSPDDRWYTYWYKGQCVPFGSGRHASEEEAIEAAKRLPVVPEDKEIIVKVIR